MASIGEKPKHSPGICLILRLSENLAADVNDAIGGKHGVLARSWTCLCLFEGQAANEILREFACVPRFEYECRPHNMIDTRC
jgi:hypothetical protein